MKLPAIQFYPGDWWRDLGVLSLNCEERGAWFQILLLMHDSEKRGALLINGNPPTDQMLANVLSLPTQRLREIIAKLLTNGVASKEQSTGALICRRMFYLHEVRSKAGSMHGSKNIAKANQITSPSSSSSSSSSLKDRERCRFAPPTLAQVVEIINDKNEAETFIDYFTSNGWKVGNKAPMRDWRAAARNWVRRSMKTSPRVQTQPKTAYWKCFICEESMPEGQRPYHMEEKHRTVRTHQ